MNSSFHRLLVLLLVQLLFSRCEQSTPGEIVSIPDPSFLEALIEQGLDKDGDGQISIPEAESALAISLGPSNISDLRGLEAFINLNSLMVRMNPLLGLDLSGNRSLRYLVCNGCELTELDLSSNPELRYLDCSGGAAMSNRLSVLDPSGNPQLEVLICSENRIANLDVSTNGKLKTLHCGRNQIQALDVSANSDLIQLLCNNNRLKSIDLSENLNLEKLITCGNQLSRLDVTGNSRLTLIGVDNMPTITEVCVWTTPFPPEGVVVLMEFSPKVYFTTQCSDW